MWCLVLAVVAAWLLFARPALADEALPPFAEVVELPWVAVHRPTGLWSDPDHARALLFRWVEPEARLQIALPQDGPRLYVWDPSTSNYAYINADDVGPSGPPLLAPLPAQPIPLEPARALSTFWSGVARVTMYSCVELGGCNRTASGIWPYEGVVAVDPRVIPLGSTVWLDGLGHFLAADTGSLVRGHHVDVYVTDYRRAIRWGVRYVNAAAYVD